MDKKQTTNKAAAKRGRLTFDKAKAKASLKPAAYNFLGAIGGGLAGAAFPPMASGLGGLGLILTGAYLGKPWLSTAGAGLLVSTGYSAVTGAGLRTSPTGKLDPATEIANGKERMKAFITALGAKFGIKAKEDSGTVSGLGNPWQELDDIQRSVEASALDFRSQRALPAHVDIDTVESRGALNGRSRPVDFNSY